MNRVIAAGLLTICILTLAQRVIAQTDNITSYKLLAPLPCIEGGGVTCPSGNGTIQSQINFVQYVQYMFNLLIAVAAATAVLMIVWGGLEYMTTTSVAGKTSGLDRVKGAVYGLVLVLCSFLILHTVDPRFTQIPSTLVPHLELGQATNQTSAFFNQLDTMGNQDAQAAQNAQLAQNIQQRQQARAQISGIDNNISTLDSQIAQAQAQGDTARQQDLENQQLALIDQKNQAQATIAASTAKTSITLSLQSTTLYSDNSSSAQKPADLATLDQADQKIQTAYYNGLTLLNGIDGAAQQTQDLRNTYYAAETNVGLLEAQQGGLTKAQFDAKYNVTYLANISDPTQRAALASQVYDMSAKLK